MKSKTVTRRFTQQLFVLSALVAGIFAAGCATKVTTGAFREVNRLETELKRGVSTKADVERVLGTPNGSGHAILPTDPRPREVWYYEDFEVTGTRAAGRGVVLMDMRQQILLVFFEKEVFDGFMWSSNVHTAVGKQTF
ncbi:MAG: hypothetical protein A3F90_05430 [Deltaproteobacteria bacterium RIFCSPLOWO2_12_FULL_60_19]|nr:MAG: hypothetical protein A3F90_05430 [Deltaproteobacteria bacterium RIFCSPLOWO2_12_FULL_60_19]